MPITPEQLEALFAQLELKVTRENDTLWSFSFGTTHYQNNAGRPHVVLYARLDNEGQFFNLYAYNAWIAAGPHTGKFFEAAAKIMWRQRLVRFMYDHGDGEVRLAAELPVRDGTFTEEQLQAAINAVMGTLEEYHPVLRKALNEGVVAFPDESDEPGTLARLHELYEAIKDLPGRFAERRAAALAEAIAVMSKLEPQPVPQPAEADGPPTSF